MKKIVSYILLVAMLAACLGGCGGAEQELPAAPDAGQPSDTLDTEQPSGTLDTEYQPDISIDPDSWGGDNSLDAYSAVVRMPLTVEEPENAIGGGGRELFLGSGKAYFFQKHLLEAAGESWDELSYVDREEQKGSQRFDFGDWLYGIGPVAGTDHYITFGYEPPEGDEGENRYFLTERDESHQAVREIPLDFLASPAGTLVLPTYLAVDGFGTVHLVYDGDEGRQYLLISPEGELISSTGSNTRGLVPLCDGRIVFWEPVWDSEGISTEKQLQCMDRETGKPGLLASLEGAPIYATLLDEDTLLYADSKGIYSSGLAGENSQLLYTWLNHGISVSGIPAMRADAEGGIALIYEDSRGYNFLCLEPTAEEVETCAITLAAVNPYFDYNPIVTEFNKRYPRWHIKLETGYDETTLLTQLGAGSGPVLVDTSLLGFEELEKLWEPLDAVMEQLGIAEELVPSVRNLGKINGVQYGAVADFYLSTLVTGGRDLKEWDYGAFLQCIADSRNLEALFNIYEGGNYCSSLIMRYLCNGMDDACFWDAEAGTTNFDSDEFRQALELAKKYCAPEEGVPMDRSLLEEGKVLVNSVYIRSPQTVAGVRIYYGEDANCIGYPTKDGSAHYVSGSAPLAIRRTATAEEKEVAVAFLSLLLSYEGQQLLAEDINFGMSVRWDMLEEQTAAMKEDTEVEMGDFPRLSFSLGDQVDVERDRATLLHLIETAEPRRQLPGELDDILYEELEQYFNGIITEDMLIDHLESRVGLYLNERR